MGYWEAFFVATTIILAPNLGATSMIALIIAGQMLGSLFLDHFGVLGYEIQPINL